MSDYCCEMREAAILTTPVLGTVFATSGKLEHCTAVPNFIFRHQHFKDMGLLQVTRWWLSQSKATTSQSAAFKATMHIVETKL